MSVFKTPTVPDGAYQRAFRALRHVKGERDVRDAPHAIPSDQEYKAPVPDALIAELLGKFTGSVETLYRRNEGSPSLCAKIALWRECLHGAGLTPDDEPVGQANLFVRHTVLVVAARLLRQLLRGGAKLRIKSVPKEIQNGFQAWLAEGEEGRAMVEELVRELNRYDWRGNARDRLKDGYHTLIARDERKEFGEYYTPDWLAKRVVDELLDNDWMDRAIEDASVTDEPQSLSGVIALDPACGSGTFLFHAAQLVHRRIQQAHVHLLPMAREIVANVVVGMDVHPVAVEMARATLEMALPDGSDLVEPQVFLGDALRVGRRNGPARVALTKAGRLMGNPPWLMANDTPDGARKENIAALRDEYGLTNKELKRKSASTEGDLAAVFASRATDLYLAEAGKFGLVLPGGALINQNWAPWRSGCWHSNASGCHVDLYMAWGLDDLVPPVFGHAPSGCCVVFGERLGGNGGCQSENGLKTVGLWSGSPEAPQVVERTAFVRKASEYLNAWRIGALSKPHCLFYVMQGGVTHVERGVRKVLTKRSTKAPWKNITLQAKLEASVLRAMATPQALSPFRVVPDTFLIAPTVRSRGVMRLIEGVADETFRKQLPLTWAYWQDAEELFQAKRAGKAAETLAGNLNFKNTLSSQLDGAGANTERASGVHTKVIYNESGNVLKAARCGVELIANQSLYWLNAESEAEALYLCGVMNAPCMQSAWRNSKTSKMHFDKSPWRSVPVERFDPSSELHKKVVEAAATAEAVAQVSANFTLSASNEGRRLDDAVAALLPSYAGL